MCILHGGFGVLITSVIFMCICHGDTLQLVALVGLSALTSAPKPATTICTNVGNHYFLVTMTIEVVARGFYVLRYLLAIALGVFCTLGLFICLTFIPKDQFILFLGVFGGLTYLILKVTKRLDKGLVNLTIDNEGLKIEWLRQFMFHNKPNEKIKWVEIVDYTYIPDQHFDIFRIRTDRKKIKLSLAETKESFYAFYGELEEKVEILKAVDKNLNVKRGRTFYETKWAVVFAIFIVLLLVAFVGLLIFRPPEKINYGSLFIFLGGAIFYVYTVWSYRQKK